MNQPQFRIRDVLVLMAFVALLAAWWVDRSRLATKLEQLEKQPKVLMLTPRGGIPEQEEPLLRPD